MRRRRRNKQSLSVEPLRQAEARASASFRFIVKLCEVLRVNVPGRRSHYMIHDRAA
jgi:hypothetical protein